ncbi:MAG TPA: PAS domain-containing sensor histidine kinase [Candidatus Limnocylindrales bacterium]|jgi:PAS domain S-box-containing protein|nr:PAS domain-containing sensor histidine kinase [Candidatus Limnocylindrales bacterium]
MPANLKPAAHGQPETTNKTPEKLHTEKAFRLLVEGIQDYAIFLLDPNGHVASWNPGAERMKRYRPEEIIGQHFSVFYTEPDLAIRKPWHELEVAAQTGRYEDEGWRLRKDRTRFWANVVITVIRDEDGTLLGFGKITRDLTDRREAEIRHRLLIEGVSDYAIYSLDPTGVITSWNTGAERIKGYSTDEILGRHFSTFYTPEDAAAGMPAHVLKTAAETGHFEGEGWRVRKDGTRFWSSVVVTAIRDEAGQLMGFSKITRDVSDRKKLLDTIQRHAEELELRIAEREQTNAELEAFSYSVSHDLRSPLRAIEGFADMIVTDFGAELPEQVKTYLGQISGATRRMNRLVQDLLEYSRLSRIDLHPTAADVGLLMEDARQQLEESQRVSVRVNVPAGLRAFVHPSTMTQIFYNLMTNGLKFYPPGKEPHVDISAERVRGKVRIMVRDEGIGIPREHHERVFQVFERLHSATKYPGTGIGLAIVKRGITRMGGTVSLQSEPGKGSTFTIEVPEVA